MKSRKREVADGLVVEEPPANGNHPDTESIPGISWNAAMGGERTLADRAYAAIHGAILEGALQPGDRLRIEDLSSMLRISPTPIREALNRLEAAGLAEHVAHRGSRVSEVSASEFRDVCELRLILEPLAVSKAAERFTPETAGVVRGHLQRLEAALQNDSTEDALEAHTAFHFTLYRTAQSRWMERLIRQLWDSCRRYRLQKKNGQPDSDKSVTEHTDILEACERHDGRTASILLHNHTVRHANIIAHARFGEAFFEMKAL